MKAAPRAALGCATVAAESKYSEILSTVPACAVTSRVTVVVVDEEPDPESMYRKDETPAGGLME